MTPNDTRMWSIEGPLPGGPVLFLANFDLAAHGYSVEEFFLDGSATSYRRADEGALAADRSSEYRTRIVVARPSDSSEFNGTVLVEWLNVTGSWDSGPEWVFTHRHIMRTGAAWVGVSAQSVGIDGGGLLAPGSGVRAADPERYASLRLPGDPFAYDIYTHAAEALRSEPALLGSGAPECLIAIGESQSAMFLVTYVNELDAQSRVYDAFLVHSRPTHRAASLVADELRARSDDVPLEPVAAMARDLTAEPVMIRDSRVPLITVQTETDVIDFRGSWIRCDDSTNTRLWEIAGSAHFDSWGMIAGFDDDGTLSLEQLARVASATDQPLGMQADEPINSGPQQHYVLMAAVDWLERWVRTGTPAPHAPPLDSNADGTALGLDEHGIAKGGVRTPWVDVPTAVLSGLGAKGPAFTSIFGVTRSFDSATLAQLYPGGLEDYMAKFSAATERARVAGFLLEDDVPEILGLAASAWRD